MSSVLKQMLLPEMRLRRKLLRVREAQAMYEKSKTYENAVALQAATRDFEALRKQTLQPVERRD